VPHIRPRPPEAESDIRFPCFCSGFSLNWGLAYPVCGKPRSILLVAGSGQRLVTTLPRV
jgi:hypothetical protein